MEPRPWSWGLPHPFPGSPDTRTVGSHPLRELGACTPPAFSGLGPSPPPETPGKSFRAPHGCSRAASSQKLPVWSGQP